MSRIILFALTTILALITVFQCGDDDKITRVNDGVNTIGLYADEGAADACVIASENMFRWMGYKIRKIYAGDVNSGNITDIDLFYFPGGSTGPYQTKINSIGRANIRQIIRDGGSYVGVCAGAHYAASIQRWQGVYYNSGLLELFSGAGIGPMAEICSGPDYCMCRLDINTGYPITNGMDDSLWIMYYTGPYFTFDSGVGDIIARYSINDNIAMASFTYGNGRVFISGPHPEWEEDSDRDSIDYFDNFDDRGSDWDLMRQAVRWCLRID